MDRDDSVLVGFEEDESSYTVDINTDDFGEDTARLCNYMQERVIGQPEAILELARSTAVCNAGLHDPRRPRLTLLLPGPTGVGKTLTAEMFSRYDLGIESVDPPLTIIEGGNFADRHTSRDLVGSPKTYVGYGEPPTLSQANIDRHHFWKLVTPYLQEHYASGNRVTAEDMFPVLPHLYAQLGPFRSVLLVDEFEKVHPRVRDTFLNLLDTGFINLSDGTRTSFANCVIIFTTNIGGADIQKESRGRGRISFLSDDEQRRDGRIVDVTMEAVRKEFKPEFLGRMDGIVVFKPLSEQSVRRILDIMLSDVQKQMSGRIAGSIPMVLKCAQSFKDAIIDKADTLTSGARELRRLVRHHVTLPLANAIESGQLQPGDEVMFFMSEDGRTVIRRVERAEPVRERSLARLQGESGKARPVPPQLIRPNGSDDPTRK